jgi:hypothetical protein
MALVARIGKPHDTTSNGHAAQRAMQEPLDHPPDALPTATHWRERFKNWWYKLEGEWKPVVVNKSIDSITMPKWIAIGILGAILTFGVQSWWKASDQRDTLIRLETQLQMSREFEAERTKQLKDQADVNKVYIDNMTNQLNVIKGMLSAQQMSAVEDRRRGAN